MPMATMNLPTARPTLWLSLTNFARRMNKHPETVRKWCESGFVVELGYFLRKDCTGHWFIGIPHNHNSYSFFL